MIDRLSPTARKVALALLLVLVLWFLWSVRSVLNPLLLGYLLAFVLHPLVLRLERFGWKRRRAVNFIFFGAFVFAGLLGLGIFMQARGLARELGSEEGLGQKVRQRVEQALEQHKDEVAWALQFVPSHLRSPQGGESGTAPQGVDDGPQEVHVEDLATLVGDWWRSWLSEEQQKQAADLGLRAASGAVLLVKGIFGSIFAFLGLAILLPIYTYFLLFELERIHRFVARYFPRRDRARLIRIASQIGDVLANFFRGRLLVCLIKGAVLALGLWIAGVEYALLIGLGTGFLTLIPFVGSLLGFVLALAVGLIEHEVAPALLRVGIVFVIAEVLENYVLLPKILGDSLGLHPIVVIFSLMAGAASLGMFGLILALPITATLVILFREFVLPVLGQIADNDGAPRAG